jgi:hypothetical protein
LTAAVRLDGRSGTVGGPEIGDDAVVAAVIGPAGNVELLDDKALVFDIAAYSVSYSNETPRSKVMVRKTTNLRSHQRLHLSPKALVATLKSSSQLLSSTTIQSLQSSYRCGYWDSKLVLLLRKLRLVGENVSEATGDCGG